MQRHVGMGDSGRWRKDHEEIEVYGGAHYRI
jgi:hypothetical protein